MKKENNLQKARRLYKKGVKFRSILMPHLFGVSSGIIEEYLGGDIIVDTIKGNKYTVYTNGKWGEIITDEIKEENANIPKTVTPKTISDIQLAQKYINIHQRATDKKIEFTLSLAKLRILMKRSKCEVTGITFSDDPKSPNYCTIDRFDRTKGYTDDNVVAMIADLNSKKGNLDINEIISLAQFYNNNFKKRKNVKNNS